MPTVPKTGGVRRRFLISGGTPIIHEQIIDVGAYLGGIAIPFIFPVTVNLPTRAGQRVAIFLAPPQNRLMRRVHLSVRSEVRRRGDEPRRRGRADNLSAPGKRRF